MGNFAFTLYEEQLLPPANEVCEGYVFTGVCLSTGEGGRAWLPGGMCGCQGACVVKGGMCGKGGHGEGGIRGEGGCTAK